MIYEKQAGVPRFECLELEKKRADYCVLIPVINEGERIRRELERGLRAGVADCADLVLCDGGSTDGSLEESFLRRVKVNTLLIKRDEGRQGAQLRMGIWWALKRGYRGIVTIDGNDKDSIEDLPRFLEKLREGFDFVQGSRFVRGGQAVNTPPIRYLSVRLIHAPIISLTAGKWYTDSTNNFRAYSRRYLEDPRVQPLREVFSGYELLAYLSVRAGQLGLKSCEVPVRRAYPKGEKTPTKISFFKGNSQLMKILILNLFGAYKP